MKNQKPIKIRLRDEKEYNSTIQCIPNLFMKSPTQCIFSIKVEKFM